MLTEQDTTSCAVLASVDQVSPLTLWNSHGAAVILIYFYRTCSALLVSCPSLLRLCCFTLCKVPKKSGDKSFSVNIRTSHMFLLPPCGQIYQRQTFSSTNALWVKRALKCCAFRYFEVLTWVFEYSPTLLFHSIWVVNIVLSSADNRRGWLWPSCGNHC